MVSASIRAKSVFFFASAFSELLIVNLLCLRVYRPDSMSAGQRMEDRLMKPSAVAVCGTYERSFTRMGDNGSANPELVADSIGPPTERPLPRPGAATARLRGSCRGSRQYMRPGA